MLRRLVLSLVILSSALARAATLEVQHGWGSIDRSERWEPVFVTASDPTPRNVTLEVVCAHETGSASIIRQQFAIGPQKRTFPLYIPAETGTWQRTAVILRDAQTEKTLAQFPPPGAAIQPTAPFNGILIGISGRAATLHSLDEQMEAAGLHSGYLEPPRLPRSAIGYDALDVLFLNQPDLAAMEDEQQQAIIAWVRAGGTLLFVPGGQAVPPSSPMAEVLPCAVGPVTQIKLTPDEARSAGLDSNETRLAARALEPKAGAEPIELLPARNGSAVADRLGFGKVIVSPVDLTGLRFSDSAHLAAFWRPLLADVLNEPPTASSTQAAVDAIAPTIASEHRAVPPFGAWN